jgi:hypothetical protein
VREFITRHLPEVREFITRHTAYNKHDTGWAKGAPLTMKTLTGMTTDVYPRENCIAPAIVLIVWTTNTKE